MLKETDTFALRNKSSPSPDRADSRQRKVLISSSLEQIEQLYDQSKLEKVKWSAKRQIDYEASDRGFDTQSGLKCGVCNKLTQTPQFEPLDV